MIGRFSPLMRVSASQLKNFRGKFHSGKPTKSSTPANDPNGPNGDYGGFLNADASKSIGKFYHVSSVALIGLTPLAFILSPSVINMPVDMLLGVLFPLHSHIALNYVISDYIPKASRSLVRAGLLGATIIAAAGILKLNVTGPGLTECIKSLWRVPVVAKKVEDKK